MASQIAPQALRSMLEGRAPFALIDVREAGEYNSSHIPGASPMPRRLLESTLPHAVPFAGTPIVICDDDGRRAKLAAATVERMGYRQGSGGGGGGKKQGDQGGGAEVGDQRAPQGVRAEGRGGRP